MGRKAVDETGNIYGKLTVIERDQSKKREDHIYWLCKCECGNIVSVTGSNLRSGGTKSCGCTKQGMDETGNIYGKLTVIERDQSKKREDHIYWKCQCECGNIVSVQGSSLRSGNTKSCGCTKSRGEEITASILKILDISYIQQKTFSDCRFPNTNGLAKFDFYLSEYNLLIEYDGIQHFQYTGNGWDTKENYEATKYRDEYKNQWCKDNHIPLLRIPYTFTDEEIMEEISNMLEDIESQRRYNEGTQVD